MTLRRLPEIKAFERGAGDMTPVPAEPALARWRPGVQAAAGDADAVISMYDVIGEDWWTGEGVTSRRVAEALAAAGSRDVTVNINSPGGDFFEGVAIYNLLRSHPHKVTVRVMGLAASAASVIAMAGDEIQISEVGFLFVHNAWTVAMGNRHDMLAAADTLGPFDDAMAGLYASRSGATREVAAAWMDAETWFNGAKSVEVGLADALLPPGEVTESDAGGAKALTAARRIEAALTRQGMSRTERRGLIGDLGSHAVAGPERPAVAGDLEADIRRLIETLRS